MKFAIHPVAGRVPGRMNVLLADGDTPVRWTRSTAKTRRADVALVIGANDVMNPDARSRLSRRSRACRSSTWTSPAQVIVLKRSMNTGFAGIDNPLFYLENTSLLFGDAKESVQQVLKAVEDL